MSVEPKQNTDKSNGDKRKQTGFSDRDRWYLTKSRALLGLERYQECLDITQQALDAVPKLHKKYTIWLLRNMAKCKKMLGHYEDAIEIYSKARNIKKEWFIEYEIAEIYKVMGNYEKVYEHAGNGLAYHEQYDFKYHLMFLFAEVLEYRNEHELAKRHYELCYALRQKNKWKIPNDLRLKIEEGNSDSGRVIEYNQIIAEMSSYWNKNFRTDADESSDDMVIGEIIKILHDNEKGKDGFLSIASTNQQAYFTVPKTNRMVDYIKVKAKVRCYLESSAKGLRAKGLKTWKAE